MIHNAAVYLYFSTLNANNSVTNSKHRKHPLKNDFILKNFSTGAMLVSQNILKEYDFMK